MTLAVRVIRKFGGFTLDVDLAVESGKTLVVVGESGAGKSTLLRSIAGLEMPDQGQVTFGSVVVFDSEKEQYRAPWERAVGYVPQDYALFPHLDVFENVAFGLRAGGADRGGLEDRVTRALSRFGLETFARRRPSQLSGGQQQRVALARALVLEPEVLLLDEPLSALDLKTRQATRSELRRLLGELTCSTVYVTHQPLEAVVFGDRIAVLENGRVTQAGTRDELLRRPRSPYVAAFLGVNLFRGSITGRDNGIARLASERGEISVVDPGGDDEIFAVVNPREIALFRAPPEGSARNCFRGPVREMIPEPPDGERVRVVVGSTPALVAEITEQAADQLGLREGEQVYAVFKATGVTVFR